MPQKPLPQNFPHPDFRRHCIEGSGKTHQFPARNVQVMLCSFSYATKKQIGESKTQYSKNNNITICGKTKIFKIDFISSLTQTNTDICSDTFLWDKSERNNFLGFAVV